MGFYDVDWSSDGLVREQVAVDKRKPRRLALLAAMLSPLAYVYGLFMTYRANCLYWLNHSSQVCYMKAVLNDAFDNVNRTITIVDGAYFDPVYSYLDDELKPVYIDLDSEVGTHVIDDPDPVPLYTDAETYDMGVQFVVLVPSVVAGYMGYNEKRLRALVDKYRLVSKSNYEVVYV